MLRARSSLNFSGMLSSSSMVFEENSLKLDNVNILFIVKADVLDNKNFFFKRIWENIFLMANL